MLKPTVTATKNMRGRITGYRALLGSIEAFGPTKQDAIAAWSALAFAQLHAPSALILHDLYRDGNHATWILSMDSGSWGYRIARPMRPGSHYDGHSACMLTVRDRRDAEIAMRSHWYAVNVEPYALMIRALGAFAEAYRKGVES